MILVFGKAKSCRVPNLGCRRLKSPRRFGTLPKNSAQDVIHEQAHCCDEAANHQLPIAIDLLNHPNSSHRGIFKLNAKSDADLLLYLHFECDSHTVHMLTQGGLLPPLTNTVKSSLFIHACSNPLSLAATLH